MASLRDGVLSWASEEIDTLEAAEFALSDAAAQQPVDGYRPPCLSSRPAGSNGTGRSGNRRRGGRLDLQEQREIGRQD